MALIGQIGQYKIIEELGRGAMGEVYKVEDTKMFGEMKALKILSESLSKNVLARHRFTEEVKGVVRLRHPNIVTVFDYGDHESRMYFVMEYLKGRTLSDWIKRSDPMDFKQKVEIGNQVCSALDFAHGNGVIHRDIKPANIMITDLGAQKVVKLLDFGIARFDTSKGRTRTQPGTYSYMSPEQIHNLEDIDPRSDLFSLGIVLYEVFTGVHPFDAESEIITSQKILYETPESLLSRNPKLPPALDGLVLELLEKDPKHRPASAGKVGESLAVIGVDWSPTESQTTDPKTKDLDEDVRLMVQKLMTAGRQLESAGEHGAALEVYRKAVALAPDSDKIHGKIEALEHRIESEKKLHGYLDDARNALAGGDLEGARALYREAWVLRPDHPDVVALKQDLAELEAGADVTSASQKAGAAEPVPAESPEERERREYVEPRVQRATTLMDEGKLHDARHILVEVIRRYHDELVAQKLLDRVLQVVSVPGLDYQGYRKHLKAAVHAIDDRDLGRAREEVERARKIWPDDQEWKSADNAINDALDSTGRELLSRIERLLRDAEGRGQEEDVALGLVAEARRSLKHLRSVGYDPNLLEGVEKKASRLEQDLETSRDRRREQEMRRSREIEEAFSRGRTLLDEGNGLADKGPSEASRARETYRLAREAFAGVLELDADHMGARDGAASVDSRLQGLEARHREREEKDHRVTELMSEARGLMSRADGLAEGDGEQLETCGRLLRDAAGLLDTVRSIDPDSRDARDLDEQREALEVRTTRRLERLQEREKEAEDGFRDGMELAREAERLAVARTLRDLQRGEELCRKGARVLSSVLDADPGRQEARDAVEKLGSLREHFRSELQRADEDVQSRKARVVDAQQLIAKAEQQAQADSSEVLDEAAGLCSKAATALEGLSGDEPGLEEVGDLRDRLDRVSATVRAAKKRQEAKDREKKAASTRKDRLKGRVPTLESGEYRIDLEEIEALMNDAESAFSRARKLAKQKKSPDKILALADEAERLLSSILEMDPKHPEAGDALHTVRKFRSKVGERARPATRPAAAAPEPARPKPTAPQPAPRSGPSKLPPGAMRWVAIGGAAVVVVVLVIALWPTGGPDAPPDSGTTVQIPQQQTDDTPPPRPEPVDVLPTEPEGKKAWISRWSDLLGVADPATLAALDNYRGKLDEASRDIGAWRRLNPGDAEVDALERRIGDRLNELDDIEQAIRKPADVREPDVTPKPDPAIAAYQELQGKLAQVVDPAGSNSAANLGPAIDSRKTAVRACDGFLRSFGSDSKAATVRRRKTRYEAEIAEMESYRQLYDRRVELQNEIGNSGAMTPDQSETAARRVDEMVDAFAGFENGLENLSGALTPLVKKDRETLSTLAKTLRTPVVTPGDWAGFHGRVCDPATKSPAAGAEVAVRLPNGKRYTATSGDDGSYRLELPAGERVRQLEVRLAGAETAKSHSLGGGVRLQGGTKQVRKDLNCE